MENKKRTPRLHRDLCAGLSYVRETSARNPKTSTHPNTEAEGHTIVAIQMNTANKRTLIVHKSSHNANPSLKFFDPNLFGFTYPLAIIHPKRAAG
jgi:hypothetical protein